MTLMITAMSTRGWAAWMTSTRWSRTACRGHQGDRRHRAQSHVQSASLVRQALAGGRGALERDRYLFRDGIGGGELPPNDWESLFGGSAWAPAGDGQWYFHRFAAEQPDLNWENEEVETSGAPCASGPTAGRRVSDRCGPRPAQGPVRAVPAVGRDRRPDREDGSHPLWDRDDVHEIYADWRRIFNSYDPPRYAVAEASYPRDEPGTRRPTVSGMRSTSRCRTRIGGRRTIAT